MQISSLVVSGIKVDMVDDLARFGTRHLTMLPLPSSALRSVAQSVCNKRLFVWAIRSFRLRCRGLCNGHFCDWALHQISSSVMMAGRKAMNLFLIGVERIVVSVPHLIMPHAHIARCDWAGAIQASPSHNLATPSVLRRPVPLLAFVMHKTEAVCGVLSCASVYYANPIEFWRCHAVSFGSRLVQYKTYGNSMAEVIWLGRRIDLAGARASA